MGGKRQGRAKLAAGVGLAMWATGVFRMLKPWLSTFYSALNTPALTNTPVGERQWAKIYAVLGEQAQATTDVSNPYFQRGWQVCQIGNSLVHNKRQCHDTISFSKGYALLRVRQPRSKFVIVNDKCKITAKRMARIFAATPSSYH